ncbi:hypothetical protein [Tabrizicola sp.]|uniref:hypothetical protein n=1 Tax=Tabrizicola sp. TaxID=2005166 RepID=UPI001A5F3BC3|nr:hypothetical protein [Tabrizicola sp.]MBL9074864.1 hypothetical protein [Tabrizicola sp.]
MRCFLFLLFACAAPATAQEVLVDTCAVDAAIACPVEVVLSGLGMIDGDPVVTGPDRLTFVALDRDKTEQAFAVDVSLTDGRVLSKIPLGQARENTMSFYWLVAQRAQGFLVFVLENERDRVLVFYDANGVPQSRMPEIRPKGWPYELTMASALMLLGYQNILKFDGEALQGRVGRFDLRLTASDSRLEVVEQGAIDDGQTFEDYLSGRLAPQIAEVGAETVHVEGQLSVVTTRESRKSPSRLFLRREDGSEVAIEQTTELDPKNRPNYFMARLSPDGRYVAVGRYVKKNGGLFILDTTTGEALFRARVRSCWSSGLRWLPEGRLALLCFIRDGIHVVVFDPHLPR